MKVLLLGASGNLGRAVAEEFRGKHECEILFRESFDLRDPAALAFHLASRRPEALINCAAYTNVDEAEKKPELAMAVNGEAPGKLAAMCREAGVVFVQPSSDYVFDGRKNSPYREDDPPNPLNVYGRSKLQGEREAAAAHPDGHLIIRTSWLFGGGRNFVRSLWQRYLAGERRFRVVADQVGRPTYAPDLARVIRLALEKGLRGIYHACNHGETSWHGFAQEIFAAAGRGEEVFVEPVTSAEFGACARRPSYSVLDTTKLERELGIVLPSYEEALRRYLGGNGGAEDGEKRGGNHGRKT